MREGAQRSCAPLFCVHAVKVQTVLAIVPADATQVELQAATHQAKDCQAVRRFFYALPGFFYALPGFFYTVSKWLLGSA